MILLIEIEELNLIITNIIIFFFLNINHNLLYISF